MRLVTSTLLLFIAAFCFGQSVRSETLGGSEVRSFVRAAQEAGIEDYPDYANGRTGTIIKLTCSLRNADMVVILPKAEVTLDDLLSDSKAIAREIGLPKTDFITYVGRRTVWVDLEFNDYIEVDGRKTSFEFGLDKIKQAVEARASKWPKPIYVMVREPQEGSRLLIEGEESVAVEGHLFYKWPDWPQGSRMVAQSEVTVLAISLGVVMISFLVFGIGMALVQPWLIERMKRKQRQKAIERRSPEEVQAEYDKQTFGKRLLTFGPIFVIPLLFFASGTQMGSGLEYLFPSSSAFDPIFLVPCMVGGFALSWLTAKLYYRRKPIEAVEEGGATQADLEEIADREAETGSLKFMLLPFLVVFIVMFGLLFVVRTFAPAMTDAQANGIKVAARVLPFLPLVALVYAGWLFRKKTVTVLRPGDPLHDEAMRVASLAGTKVKRVVVKRSGMVNAYATPFSTVGVTSNLVRRLEPEEVLVIVAHEIGHLRLGHAKRNLWITLPIMVVFLAGINLLIRALPSKAFPVILFGQMMIFPLLLIVLTGKGRRRAEHEADAFAVKAIGDADLVARALVKVHNLNESPHNLRSFDEYLSTHTSLKKRIDHVMSVPAG